MSEMEKLRPLVAWLGEIEFVLHCRAAWIEHGSRTPGVDGPVDGLRSSIGVVTETLGWSVVTATGAWDEASARRRVVPPIGQGGCTCCRRFAPLPCGCAYHRGVQRPTCPVHVGLAGDTQR